MTSQFLALSASMSELVIIRKICTDMMKQHDETNILHQQQAQTISDPNQRPRIIGRENYERYANMINYQEKVV